MLDVLGEASGEDVGISHSPAVDGDLEFEPHDGIEFESHEAAYSFYQEYAKTMGFTTSIKNSRRSKKSKEFIDAKFACSRYGVTPESDSGNSRRLSVRKTDCKASMHVKRNTDGKWYIHEFIKDHNHELLPALAYHFRIHKNKKLAEKNNTDILHAVSERTKKMYVEMSRQSGGGPEIGSLKNSMIPQFEKGRSLALAHGDAQVLLDFFTHTQRQNPFFFYAIDLNEDQCLRNVFWVDAKSRKDYKSFSDVVLFDTSFIKTNEKMPLASIIGVNHHFQPMLFGCGLVVDDAKSTFVWLLKTWLRAMGGQAPKVLLTDQEKPLKAAVAEVFPSSRHFYALWHIIEKVHDTLAHVINKHENFMRKFNKCIFGSLTDEEFDLRWWKMVGRFELHENEWVHSLYEDRKRWIPFFMKDAFLAGMSTAQRSESVISFFDKYVHKICLKEFLRQYGVILQNRYEEEAIADFDTWHKQPALKSPSPWEKQMSTIYTHAIFKKFQVEVLGVVGCHPKKENEHEGSIIYKVDDCEKGEKFSVVWNEAASEVSCSCLMFECKGFLCRHGMIVLQLCGLSSIPVQYILKRWTKEAKNCQPAEINVTRVQRYNDLCRHAIELGEEGCLSEESYNIAYSGLVEGLRHCVDVNNRNAAESSVSPSCLRDVEDDYQGVLSTKGIKKKCKSKKRKVQSEQEDVVVEAQGSLHTMDNLNADGIALKGYYGTQQNVQGLIQLNLMEPPRDSYYINQQNIQALEELNAIGPGQDAFFATQQSMSLGHLDFRPENFTYGLQDVAPRAGQLQRGNGRRA